MLTKFGAVSLNQLVVPPPWKYVGASMDEAFITGVNSASLGVSCTSVEAEETLHGSRLNMRSKLLPRRQWKVSLK